VLNNIRLNNVPTAVGILNGQVVLAGGTITIPSWGQGNIYVGTNPTGQFTQGSISAANKPSSLLDSSGRIFGRGHPQYTSYAVSQFVSVKDNGAVGDGVTDDTAALNDVLAKVRLLARFCAHSFLTFCALLCPSMLVAPSFFLTQGHTLSPQHLPSQLGP
jgi:Pectate lyase superfamily protein